MRDGIDEGFQLLVRRSEFRRTLDDQPFEFSGTPRQLRLRLL